MIGVLGVVVRAGPLGQDVVDRGPRQRADVLAGLLDRRVVFGDGGRLHLRPSNVALLEDDLAVQIGEFDILVVDQSKTAHARRGEVERDRRAKAAHADDRHGGTLESPLPGFANLGEDPLPVMPGAGHERASMPTNAS